MHSPVWKTSATTQRRKELPEILWVTFHHFPPHTRSRWERRYQKNQGIRSWSFWADIEEIRRAVTERREPMSLKGRRDLFDGREMTYTIAPFETPAFIDAMTDFLVIADTTPVDPGRFANFSRAKPEHPWRCSHTGP